MSGRIQPSPRSERERREPGHIVLVLHAHLPFVRHPEYDDCLEERWLYEAMTETYIPLILCFERLVRDGVRFRVTMTLTPPLLSMLSDPLLQTRYRRYLDRLVELSGKELIRTRLEPHFHRTVLMYRRLLEECRRLFVDRYGMNLVAAFKEYADLGVLEAITCGATHGFLPFMESNPKSIEAQVEVGVRTHRRLLGAAPKGIWLPECGYTPLVDRYLAAEGIRYFFADTHGILHGQPRPAHGVHAPVRTPGGIFAFGRDVESSQSVWSSKVGYPGDYDYRDFYRDIGFDLDFDYIRPYIHDSGLRCFTGMKYHRITGPTDQKEPYDPEVARAKVRIHAADFLLNRTKQVEHLRSALGIQPVVVCPYDAELFGHWWFEGPWFLEELFRIMDRESGVVRLTTPSEYMERHPSAQEVDMAFSSWGDKGYGYVWLNGTNDWIYRHLHWAEEQMEEVARRYRRHRGDYRRVLDQMARELLLAQSSDWAFIMNGKTTVEYAVRRTKSHLFNFLRLCDGLREDVIDRALLDQLEKSNNIFPDMDFRVFC